MKIGLLAYSSPTGLGYQTYNFYRYMQPEKVLVVDLSASNRMGTDHAKFGDQAIVCQGYPQNYNMEWLSQDMDCVFVCENPLNYHLYDAAKRNGAVSISQYNYEFLDYFQHPDWLKPDFLAAPTRWGRDKVEELNVAPVLDLPVPFDRAHFPARHITKCTTFIHVVGRPSAFDRNGTLLFLEAAQRLGNRFSYKVFIQRPEDDKANEHYQALLPMLHFMRDGVEVIYNTKDNADIYKSGDVLVLPRRYGGLCLPANEALSSGLPVVMPDISPNEYLPQQWRCKAHFQETFDTRPWVDMYEADVDSLCATMLQFGDNEFMSEASLEANDIASLRSWGRLLPFYHQQLESMCQASQ